MAQSVSKATLCSRIKPTQLSQYKEPFIPQFIPGDGPQRRVRVRDHNGDAVEKDGNAHIAPTLSISKHYRQCVLRKRGITGMLMSVTTTAPNLQPLMNRIPTIELVQKQVHSLITRPETGSNDILHTIPQHGQSEVITVPLRS